MTTGRPTRRSARPARRRPPPRAAPRRWSQSPTRTASSSRSRRTSRSTASSPRASSRTSAACTTRVNGSPVGSDYAKSRELGIKFDFLDGKISGTHQPLQDHEDSWAAEPWYAPAPMGNPRFNPNKDIVYELSGGFNAQRPARRDDGPRRRRQPGRPDPEPAPGRRRMERRGGRRRGLHAPERARPPLPGRQQGDRRRLPGRRLRGQPGRRRRGLARLALPGRLQLGPEHQQRDRGRGAASTTRTRASPAFQVIDQSKGWDGEITLHAEQPPAVRAPTNVDSSVQPARTSAIPEVPLPAGPLGGLVLPERRLRPGRPAPQRRLHQPGRHLDARPTRASSRATTPRSTSTTSGWTTSSRGSSGA